MKLASETPFFEFKMYCLRDGVEWVVIVHWLVKIPTNVMETKAHGSGLSVLFRAETWGRGVKKTKPPEWSVADFHSSGPIVSTSVLTLFYGDHLLPYPGPAPHPPQRLLQWSTSPSSSYSSTSSPFHAAYPCPINFPNIPSCASSTHPTSVNEVHQKSWGPNRSSTLCI